MHPEQSSKDILISLKQKIRETYQPLEFEKKILKLEKIPEKEYEDSCLENAGYFLAVENSSFDEQTLIYLRISYHDSMRGFRSMGISACSTIHKKGDFNPKKDYLTILKESPIESAPKWIHNLIIDQLKEIEFFFFGQFEYRKKLDKIAESLHLEDFVDFSLINLVNDYKKIIEVFLLLEHGIRLERLNHFVRYTEKEILEAIEELREMKLVFRSNKSYETAPNGLFEIIRDYHLQREQMLIQLKTEQVSFN